ncbi:MAG: hypothetical protein AAFX40_11730 [Cyanobacteria bacterium J06639_1]
MVDSPNVKTGQWSESGVKLLFHAVYLSKTFGSGRRSRSLLACDLDRMRVAMRAKSGDENWARRS